MHLQPLCLLALAVLAAPSDGGLARTKRQDWNFPGPVDTGNGGRPPATPSTPPNQPPPNQPTPNQPAPTQPPSTNTEMGTLPPNGVTVFSAPCGRCMTTPQYNPVCGTDSRTYANQGILDCARLCGFNVQFGRLGVCATPR